MSRDPPDFSNVKGGGSSSANPTPDFSNVQSGGSSTATRIYVVKSGDSLSKIAKAEYGDANAWKRIFEAVETRLVWDPAWHAGMIASTAWQQ